MIQKKEMQITSGMLTDKGDRKLNEDYADYIQNSGVQYFILCDGLGGHGNGDVASKFVVRQMKEELEYMPMERAIQNTQDALLEKQRRENAENSMKTTLTCLEIKDRMARFAHVGDSRIYQFAHGKYIKRTLDHSVSQMLVNNGTIKESEIRFHEDRSRLLRVMGAEWTTPQYQISEAFRIRKKMAFLLCSDGFWELIDEKMMEKTLKKAEAPLKWLEAMQEIIIANGRGGNMDNYTAIAVFVC